MDDPDNYEIELSGPNSTRGRAVAARKTTTSRRRNDRNGFLEPTWSSPKSFESLFDKSRLRV